MFLKAPIEKDINSMLSLLLARINQFIMHQENAAGLELCKGSEAPCSQGYSFPHSCCNQGQKPHAKVVAINAPGEHWGLVSDGKGTRAK